MMLRRATPRRSKGEGSIYRRRADGRWVACLKVTDGGRPRALYRYRHTQAEARSALHDLRSIHRIGRIPASGLSKTTFGQLCDEWLLEKKPTIRSATIRDYTLAIDQIKAALGSTKLVNLRSIDMLNLVNGFRDAEKFCTAKKIHDRMKTILNFAMRRRIIVDHEFIHTKSARYEGKAMVCFDEQECSRFLKAARGDALFALYGLAAVLGVREGELCALVWGDVDFEKNTLQIQKTFDQVDRLDGPAKTKRSRRNIAVSTTLMEWLREHKSAEVARRKSTGRNDRLFSAENGGALYFSNVYSRSFKPLLSVAGVPDIRFHDLRHTAATLMLKRGTNPKIVSELLGHESVAITLKLYGHVLPGMARDAVEKMDDLFI